MSKSVNLMATRKGATLSSVSVASEREVKRAGEEAWRLIFLLAFTKRDLSNSISKPIKAMGLRRANSRPLRRYAKIKLSSTSMKIS